MENGMPNAPTVQILDGVGTMAAGHYYFAILQEHREPRSGFGIMKGSTIGQNSGMLSLGPATHVKSKTSWNTVRISDIPIDFERQYARIFMSVNGRDFYQIAVAPAISTRQYYDMSEFTQVFGEQQESGLHRVTIVNPAQRFRENVGTMITRDPMQKTYPFELNTIDFQETFSQPNHTNYETANHIPPMPAFQISGNRAIYPLQSDRMPPTELKPLNQQGNSGGCCGYKGDMLGSDKKVYIFAVIAAIVVIVMILRKRQQHE